MYTINHLKQKEIDLKILAIYNLIVTLMKRFDLHYINILR
jgi:hypothetical protein